MVNGYMKGMILIMDKKDLISNLSGITSNLQTQINGKANSSHTHTSANISDLQGKLDAKANSSHTHTKSEISDFPTSLPANGGNADTLDGKHANDFLPVTGGNYGISLRSLTLTDYGTPFECSKYIDFHVPDSSKDYDGRLYVEGNRLVFQSDSSMDITGEINNLKSSVSNGKNAIASAITSKGVAATGSEDFNSLSNKIKKIPSGMAKPKLPDDSLEFIEVGFQMQKVEPLAIKGDTYTFNDFLSLFDFLGKRVLIRCLDGQKCYLKIITDGVFDYHLLEIGADQVEPVAFTRDHNYMIINPLGGRVEIKLKHPNSDNSNAFKHYTILRTEA